MTAYIFLVAALILNAAANILIKFSQTRLAETAVPATGMAAIIQTYLNWPFLVGIGCFGLNLLAYTQALKRLPLSMAYPFMITLGYLIILVVSWFLFQERLTATKYVGAVLMIGGLWLLVR
jgi:multidrug transporter EmrE-like cation transporter